MATFNTITINVRISLGRTGVFLTLCCLIQEHGMSPYLFNSYFRVHQSALKFSSQLFCTFLCTHLAKPQQDAAERNMADWSYFTFITTNLKCCLHAPRQSYCPPVSGSARQLFIPSPLSSPILIQLIDLFSTLPRKQHKTKTRKKSEENFCSFSIG